MTQSDKLSILRTMVDETDNAILSTYLDIAGRKICTKAYPFDPDKRVVPEKYAYLQVEIAAYLINKRGGEGETLHIENGIHRGYENANVPDSLMREITPFVSTLRG